MSPHRQTTWRIVESLLWMASAAMLGVIIWECYTVIPLILEEIPESFVAVILFEMVPLLFWFVGTLTLLLIRPRSERWVALILFQFLTGMFVQLGVLPYQDELTRIMEYSIGGLFVPVCIHLHLLIPNPLFANRRTGVLALLYAATGGLIALLILRVVDPTLIILLMLATFITSLGMILARFFDAYTSPSARLTAGLMLAGIGFGLGPGVVWWIIDLSQRPAGLPISNLVFFLLYFAIPLLPLFYTYAVFKHNLGALEFRANRLLGAYSFFVLYAILMATVFTMIVSWTASATASILVNTLIAFIFVLAAPPLQTRFQRAVDLLAYGARHNPQTITDHLARRLPSAFQTESVSQLLSGEILPSLLVRQSSLYRLSADSCEVVYAHGIVPVEATQPTRFHILALLAEDGRYRPEPESDPVADAFRWVRLAIPLEAQGKIVGAWLFGRRDPDDYYPRSDIQLLRSMANILAMIMENARLIDTLQEMSLELLRAQQTERQELAARLHDEPLQRAWAAASTLDMLLARSGGRLGARTAGILRQQKDELRRMIEELRAICLGLRSPLLNEDLESVIRETVRAFQEREPGVTVSLVLYGARSRRPDHSNAVKDAAYHVVTEALQNVAKHARATRARVRLRYGAKSLVLSVEDNGAGMAEERTSFVDLIRERHFGLVGLHQWAKLAGGELILHSAKPHGTIVTLTIPTG